MPEVSPVGRWKMAKSDFRVVGGESEELPPTPATIALKLKDVFPLLARAQRHHYAWLEDMADDQIIVTADLADILSHFKQLLDEKTA